MDDLILENGSLYRLENGGRTVYDLNREYAGYYPRCAFTALLHADGQYLLAGVDGEGAPHLFLSLLGGVWEERPLYALSPVSGQRRLTGAVVRILWDEEDRQFLLVCANGEIAVLPDCPKCMRILRLDESDSDGPPAVMDARIERPEGEREPAFLCLALRDGGDRRIPLSRLRQYRVSLSYARDRLREGALLLDVRSRDMARLGPIPHSRNVPLDELESALETVPEETVLLFICRTGALADTAAKYARSWGFRRAYSAGGTERWAHIE